MQLDGLLFLVKQVCLPTVVMEFLRQAKAARLFTMSENFDFDDYLDSELSRAFGGMERLDIFFPFDPCLLKRSDRFILFDLDLFLLIYKERVYMRFKLQPLELDELIIPTFSSILWRKKYLFIFFYHENFYLNLILH